MITEALLNELRKITTEEEKILNGRQGIEKEIYMSTASSYGENKDIHHQNVFDDENNIIDAKKLLDTGKLIQVRPHTRFIHFPLHTHNYIEVIYMCTGKTHHVINGNDVILKEGELLFLNQKAQQEIYPASKEDIAVNFIILPEFFDYGLRLMGEDKNLLKDFVIDCLKGDSQTADYLHFKVADVVPVQNLVENLIWTIWNKQPNRRSINQVTMGLLFLQLLNYIERVETNSQNSSQKMMIDVLGYIEEHYRDGGLNQLAELLNYDVSFLSKEIKKITGRNYTDLVQEKRLNQAAYLLENTSMSVMDIGLAVGYDNLSYFHRIFQKRYGVTPRKYRIRIK